MRHLNSRNQIDREFW